MIAKNIAKIIRNTPSVPNAQLPFRTYAVNIATVFAFAIIERSIPPIKFDSIIANAKKPNSGI